MRRRARRPFGEVQVIVMGDADHGTGWRAAMDRRRFLSGHFVPIGRINFPMKSSFWECRFGWVTCVGMKHTQTRQWPRCRKA